VLQRQYEAWPYPKVPLLASLPSTHPWQLHCSWLWDRCGSGTAPARPRIWNAGCGTFQPYVFALANPRAEIVATDLSRRSLAIARRRCRLRAIRNVAFAPCDLDDASTWPDGQFDLIECYGVLMNLADPAAALAGMAARLTPGGVLRLMVYPQYSRTRVFQIQRLAQLLGLHAGDRSHPGRLRAAMRALPVAHPLRAAFTGYDDSRSDAGIVDGFLHAGDRGFTAFQLGELVQQAGLRPAYWFHRPWAQPDVMAEALGLQGCSQSFVLNYLDLWQELRGNFIVCLRRDDAATPAAAAPMPHPLFTGREGSLRHRLRLLRLQLFGGAVPHRTGDDEVVLTPTAARALARGENAVEPLMLGGAPAASALPPHTPFAREEEFLAAPLRLGRRAPNPFYAHLFAAFELAQRHPELGLPDLATQCARWEEHADPLETAETPFGLTPYGTRQHCRIAIDEYLAEPPRATAASWSEVRLRHDEACLQQARSFASEHGATGTVTDAELRKLWLLLSSHRSMFLHLEG
jgi:SAM-dependent methyltransferase